MWSDKRCSRIPRQRCFQKLHQKIAFQNNIDYLERCSHENTGRQEQRLFLFHSQCRYHIIFHKCPRQMVCMFFHNNITRNLSIESNESRTMWPTLIFALGSQETFPLNSGRACDLLLLSHWCVQITRLNVFRSDYLQVLVFLLCFYKHYVFCLLQRSVCFLLVSVYSGTHSNCQHCKRVSSATARSLTISGTSSLLATWADRKLETIISIWTFTIYLFWCLVTALVCH